MPLDYHDGYIVCAVGQRLVFEANTAAMMSTAISTFVMEHFGVAIDSERIYQMPDRDDFSVAGDYLIYNDTAALYQIIYDGSYMQKRYSYAFYDGVKASVGRSNLLLVHTETCGSSPTITMTENSALEQGHWQIEVASDQKSLSVSARDYYGFHAAAKYLSKAIKEASAAYPFEAGAVLSGTHVELLEELEGSCAYAYDKQSEYRVMFYNVLWGNPEPQERNGLAATMILEYMPDVIGFQEFNSTKRGGGAKGIPSLLASAGYVETIDPKVENMKSEEDGGWGIGGIKVERDDGSVYYTYYNCVPIFYNQNTTECIDSGYYWYKNQVDAENKNNCGATDCASKSLTWGVFRSKVTGEEYMVISTHMCTRSNGVRGKQAEEAVALINELLKTYDVPVFFGGDFNGTIAGNNYKLFVSDEVGYIDIADKELATEHTTQVNTMHTAPVYNETKELVWPSSTDNAGLPGGSDSSVDHIFLTNEDSKQVDISVFGVIVDECSRSASDHLPIFVDFSLS